MKTWIHIIGTSVNTNISLLKATTSRASITYEVCLLKTAPPGQGIYHEIYDNEESKVCEILGGCDPRKNHERSGQKVLHLEGIGWWS